MTEADGVPPTEEPIPARLKPRGLIRRMVLKSPAAAIHPESVPVPPESQTWERPERPFTNFASGFLSFLVIILFTITAIFVAEQRQISAAGPLAADKIVIVRGSTADVVDQLEREGVTDKGFLLSLYWQLTGKGSQIKGGEYLFRKEVSLEQITETLIEGKSILHPITVPEGRTSDEIVDILRDDPNLSGDIKVVPKEGTLLPETYKFARGMTRTQLLEHMAQDQARLVREIWAKRSPDLPISSPLDLVTLASIVEKETGKADERPRVAAVFINRLRLKMQLQSDPTVTYGLVGGKGSLGHGLTKAELQQATPYNTYVIPGLPPGPITNPGRAALEAVANPSQTKDLYFVADGTGGHVFADSLEQHQKNVAKWRQIEGEKTSDAPSAPSIPATTVPATPLPATTAVVPVPMAPKPTPEVQPSVPKAQPKPEPKPEPKPVQPAPIKPKAAKPPVKKLPVPDGEAEQPPIED